jgi:N-acetylglutamate synthase-like GNAT family acetyltransferase
MPLQWIHESPAHWDARKATIVGGAPPGTFAPASHREGELLPGEWWRVEEDGRVLGYGWMDCTWGEAEILLAVDPESRMRGVGSFILERLEREAAARGMEYMQNVVRPGHPDRARVTEWLRGRGFQPARDEDRLARRVSR